MLEISYSLVAVALIALIVYSIFLVRKISNVVLRFSYETINPPTS